MSFQRTVNSTPAPAVAGDFASANPRASVLASPGGLVAGSPGVTVGKFGWVGSDDVTAYSHSTNGKQPDGFVHREQQALITVFLAEQSSLVPVGLPVTLHDQGEFWAVNKGPSALNRGDSIYADFSTGDIYQAVPTGASATGVIGSTDTAAVGSTDTASVGATFTATGTGTSFAVTSVTGLISIGDTISGTGVPAGTTILAQVSGTPGGAGTYTTSATTTSIAATVTAFGTVLNATAVTGYVAAGDTLSGTNIPAGTTILTQLTGTAGAAGTYRLSQPTTQYVASATMTTFGTTVNFTAVTGYVAVGDTVSGTGIPTGSKITSQLTGTAGSTGLYSMSLPAAGYVASGTLTTFGGTINITAISSGSVLVGDLIAGTGVPSGAVLSAQLTGTTGGIGLYSLTPAATAYAASTTITVTEGIVTKWKAASPAAVGELVKITTWGN